MFISSVIIWFQLALVRATTFSFKLPDFIDKTLKLGYKPYVKYIADHPQKG